MSDAEEREGKGEGETGFVPSPRHKGAEPSALGPTNREEGVPSRDPLTKGKQERNASRQGTPTVPQVGAVPGSQVEDRPQYSLRSRH